MKSKHSAFQIWPVQLYDQPSSHGLVLYMGNACYIII